ncbi:hypothetical protein ABLE91_16695 [Aquabacter sp. CN5-332]|uniref:hypothetical protein n=1 Tax=Aquabacter sp. CN5-332 TaxID=3156608 RepID=UPI0032B31E79
MTLIRTLALLALLFLPVGAALSGAASAGPPAAAALAGPLPRVVTSVDGLDIVLVLSGDDLFAFVDRAEDNAPASVGELTVEIGKTRWILQPVSNGLFEAAHVALAAGHWPLTVSLGLGGGTARIETAIDIVSAPASAPASHRWVWWLVAVVAALAGAGILYGERLARLASLQLTGMVGGR